MTFATPAGPWVFGVTDVVDIAATSVVAYYLLLLIRGTRAVQIMLGVVVLLVVAAGSNLLHLLVLATIVQYVLLGTAVTLPIVFQPELRRLLEQLGRGRFLPSTHDDPQENVETLVATLAQATEALARERIGALIVIERRTGLREYVESGTPLDARLSVDLLLALFHKGSPLHDGAVIVRELLVEGAGCFLPLSENVAAGRHLGTRHRAAVGITEQTDALVVVVSEQTGAITVARDGRLSVAIEGQDRLRNVLMASIDPAARRSRELGRRVIARLRPHRDTTSSAQLRA